MKSETSTAHLNSWLKPDNYSDFSIHNIPFGIAELPIMELLQ
jgi:hypothetical protein